MEHEKASKAEIETAVHAVMNRPAEEVIENIQEDKKERMEREAAKRIAAMDPEGIQEGEMGLHQDMVSNDPVQEYNTNMHIYKHPSKQYITVHLNPGSAPVGDRIRDIYRGLPLPLTTPNLYVNNQRWSQ